MYLAFTAGILAGLLTACAGFLLAIARDAGYFDLPEIIIWPVTGATVFGAIFFMLDRFLWRWRVIRTAIGIPDISGVWNVEGSSYDQDQQQKYQWCGKIEIHQKYEKIFVCLLTEKSRSYSLSAALIPEGRRYRLIYSFRNEPKPGEAELRSHIGHCEFLFEPDLQSAEGSYFNGRGRSSHGKMTLQRSVVNAA
jgi:hypothetical protein